MSSSNNLSLTIIFPEDTYITGEIIGHIFVTDLWLVNYILGIFSLLIISMVFMTFTFVALLGIVRCVIECTDGDIPGCLKACIRPRVHDYHHFVKKAAIVETHFTETNVMFAQADCWICLEPFAGHEDRIAILLCDHAFHIGCIKAWIDQKTEKSMCCPVCKQDLRKSKQPQPKLVDGDQSRQSAEDDESRVQAMTARTEKKASDDNDEEGQEASQALPTDSSMIELADHD